MRLETAALERQVLQKLEQERGERLDDDAFLNAIYRRILDGAELERSDGPDDEMKSGGCNDEMEASGGRDRTSTEGSSRVKDRAPYQVAVITCVQCKRGWQDSGGITVEMSPAALETALCDAEHIGSLDGDQVDRAKQDIPPALRRKVKRRDHGRCRVTACRSSVNLDIHHIVPREKGGTNDVENLITLCEGHHLAHHAGALLIEGPASKARFTKRAHNSFTIAKHAVDTARALKEAGFDKYEVKHAIEKTRAHVGTTELALEQWINIALSYCPKPTSK
ncbi:MAG TPA: HNH endonuclease signature motif containing protein [Kofleriaceae bacterium]